MVFAKGTNDNRVPEINSKLCMLYHLCKNLQIIEKESTILSIDAISGLIQIKSYEYETQRYFTTPIKDY